MNIRKHLPLNFPHIICLCGSTRFSEEFKKQNLEETIAGNIVLSIGCDTKPACNAARLPAVRGAGAEAKKKN
jgi:hypothetical protein